MAYSSSNGTLEVYYFENSVFAIFESNIKNAGKKTSSIFRYHDEEWKIQTDTVRIRQLFSPSIHNTTVSIHNLTRQSSCRKGTPFLMQLWLIGDIETGSIQTQESEEIFDQSRWKWDFQQPFKYFPGSTNRSGPILLCRIICTGNKELNTKNKWIHAGMQAVSNDLKTVVKSGKHADVVLKLGDEAFPAHKVILSCRSRVFEAMFDHDTEESRNNVVDLVNMDAAVAKMMLQYIYTGQVEELSADNMMDLYSVADRYSLTGLLDQCREFITDHINMDNVCDVAILADLHSDDDLMCEVQDFFCENIESILQSQEREMIAEKYSQLYIKLVETAVLRNKST